MESEEVQEFIASANSANFCVSERDSNVTRGALQIMGGDTVYCNTQVPSELGTNSTLEAKEINNEKVECIIEKFLELKKENDQLNKELIGEKHRTQKYQKKLKYIQENHVIFERLKQAYMNMKFTEPLKPITMSERSVQCAPYNVSSKQINQDNVDKEGYTMVISNKNGPDEEIYVDPDFLAIRKSVLDGLRDTVSQFKQMIISQPLSTFVLSKQREARYRTDIANLYQENQSLKQLAIDKQIELDELKNNLEPRNSVFRKIIAKMAYKMKSLNALNAENEENDPANLNDKEVKVIEQIYKKFDSKMKQKSILQFYSSTEETITENNISENND